MCHAHTFKSLSVHPKLMTQNCPQALQGVGEGPVWGTSHSLAVFTVQSVMAAGTWCNHLGHLQGSMTKSEILGLENQRVVGGGREGWGGSLQPDLSTTCRQLDARLRDCSLCPAGPIPSFPRAKSTISGSSPEAPQSAEDRPKLLLCLSRPSRTSLLSTSVSRFPLYARHSCQTATIALTWLQDIAGTSQTFVIFLPTPPS